MSVIIKLKDTGEVFDVPVGFVMEIKNTSPIFNKLGSKTLSASLPLSVNNCRIIEFANRPDRRNKTRTKLPVILSFGSYVREGLLYFNGSTNTEYSFSITIAFNEGIMYEDMEDLELNQLNNLPIIRMNNIDAMISLMNEYSIEDGADEELSVFKIALKEESYKVDGTTTKPVRTYINNRYSNSIGRLYSPKRITILYEGELREITVPEGFGISPFIRVWKVLELIFNHFGYKVGKNPFRQHFQLKRLCILNNVIDAIVGGVLDYKQLMPSVSVMTFLQSLYCRFGLKVFFDNAKNEVNLYLLKDIFDSQNTNQINTSSMMNIEEAVPKQLKLSAQRNLDKSQTETETYEEFLQRYNNTVSMSSLTSSKQNGGVYYAYDSGLFYRASLKPKLSDEQSIKIISSIQFDWNKNDKGYEIEEITSEDECLTMDAWGNCPYYGIEPQLLNSDFTINGKYINHFSGENKLAYVYDMGEAYYSYSPYELSYLGFKFGSIFTNDYKSVYSSLPRRHLDRRGNTYSYALTFVGEDGAYNQFFKQYDAFLRHSNNVVKIKAQIPVHQLSTINFASKILVENQLYLIDKLEHNLGEQMSTEAVIEARTLRLYHPYDLDKDQYLPTPIPIAYQWVLRNDRSEYIQLKVDKLRREYATMFPGERILSEFYSITHDDIGDRENQLNEYWMLPPTVEQLGSTIASMDQICQCVIIVTVVGKQDPHKVYCDIKYKSFLRAEVLE